MADQFTLDQLRVFIAVAEKQSFTKAAEALFLSQPAVSQQIRTLERELQVVLFERHGKRFALTEEGEALRDRAYRIIREVNDAIGALARLHDQEHHVLHIGATESIANYLLPRELGSFSQDFPACGLELRTHDTSTLSGALASHEIDLALVDDLTDTAPSVDLTVCHYRHDEIALAVSRCHPLSYEDDVSVQELYDLPLIVQRHWERRPPRWLEPLKRAHVSTHRLKFTIEMDTLEGIKRAVAAGAGASFLPLSAIEDEVARGTLMALRVRGADLTYAMHAVVSQAATTVPHLHPFLSQLGVEWEPPRSTASSPQVVRG